MTGEKYNPSFLRRAVGGAIGVIAIGGGALVGVTLFEASTDATPKSKGAFVANKSVEDQLLHDAAAPIVIGSAILVGLTGGITIAERTAPQVATKREQE